MAIKLGSKHIIQSYEKNGIECLFKNGIRKDGKNYSYFKTSDKVRDTNGKQSYNSNVIFTIFTKEGNKLDKGMEVTIKTIDNVSTQVLPNGKIAITLTCDVKVEERQNNSYEDYGVVDDDLPF